jgi:CubicO group peptidase (beta-lactamase class C family)
MPVSKSPRVLLLVVQLVVAQHVAAVAVHAQATYYPPPGTWERRAPEQVGLTTAAVDSAVKLAMAAESTSPRDLLQSHLSSFGREPHGEAVGPFRARGGATGVIIRRGYIVAEWGEPDRPENTYSVTKSFVSTSVGLAYDRKMIRDLKDPVRLYVPPVVALKGAPSGIPALAVVPPNAMGAAAPAATPKSGVAYDAFEMLEPFASEHNAKITWDHMLRQTSDWQGTLWGKPDWADRPQGNLEQYKVRARNEPGTVYTYNDVRVNALALASLMVWRQPLPQVLRERVMDPIGASNTWRWYGYDNSWIVLDGQLIQSMSGGAHWGGGMIISARDMARFGYLTLRKGKWGDRQILSEEWIRMATTPGVNAGYGFMNYFLNTGRRAMPSAPEESFQHRGAGNNVIYVDPVNDLVVVARWINSVRSMDAVIRQLLAGIK